MTDIVNRLIRRALAAAQRHLRTDIRYFASGMSWLLASETVSHLTSIATTLALANLISPDVFGKYQYVQAVASLLVLASLPGIQVALARAVADGRDGALRVATTTRFRWALLGSAAGVSYGLGEVFRGEPSVGWSVIIVAVALPVSEPASLYVSFLTGRRLFKMQAVYSAATQVVLVCATLAALWLAPSLLWLTVAMIASTVLVNGVGFITVVRRYVTNERSDVDLVSYGRSMTILQVVSVATLSLDRLLIYQMLGGEALAVFTMAMLFPRRFKGLLGLVGDLAFPKFVSRSAQAAASALPRKLMFEAAVVLAVTALYAASVPWIFRVFFPQYVDSILLAQVVSLYTLIGLSYPVGTFLQAHRRVRELYALQLGVFGFKALTFVVLTPWLGLWGAVIATLVEMATNLLICAWLLRRETRSHGLGAPVAIPL